MTIRVLREVDPTIVLTCPPVDYMLDHEQTSRLVRNATFVAPIPNYDCGIPTKPTSCVPHLYYWDPTGQRDIYGRPFPLSCAVDVTSVMDIKEDMLARHDSQRAWLRHHHHTDQYIRTMKDRASAHGKLIGRPAAEAFAQHLGSEYPNDNILAGLLGDLCFSL